MVGGSGLDQDGFIVREPAIGKIQPEYAPVVGRLRELGRAAFGESLHGLYLYGSIPRGAAIPHQSDLDALVLLNAAPTAMHADAVDRIGHELSTEFPLLTEAGILLRSAAEILSLVERYDMGFFVKCLCVGIEGENLLTQLPDYQPSLALAAGTNGNIGAMIAAAMQRLGAATNDAAVRAICRGTMRKLVRTGFTLIMPRAGCWTNNLPESYGMFARYYPAQSGDMARVLDLAQTPSADRSAIERMLTTIGTWLVREYEVQILVPCSQLPESRINPPNARAPEAEMGGR